MKERTRGYVNNNLVSARWKKKSIWSALCLIIKIKTQSTPKAKELKQGSIPVLYDR